MKALLIAEKPSLMKDIQNAYRKYGHKDTIDFKTFAGHTMSLQEPKLYNPSWEKWDLNVLPMIPAEFKYLPTKDKLTMYQDIKRTIETGGYDYIINACDPGREGQHIFFSFYDSLNLKIPVKRIWHNDQTEGELHRALTNLRDENEPALRNMTIASKFRAFFDWLVGLNGTRAISVIANKKINVGRVMTPVLNILVERELELRNFVPKDFWEIEGDFGAYKGIYFDDKNENETKFMHKNKAEAVIAKLGKQGTIINVTKKKDTKYAPSLHSLQELSNEANRVYGYTMAETLEIAQELYQDKILSYPRTDSQHITTAISKEFTKYLKSVACVPELEKLANEVMKDSAVLNKVAKDKKYVDDKKVTDHYAIIPTGVSVDLAKLTTKQRNLFTLVAKRFLAIFLPPMITNKSNVITESNGQLFNTTGSVLVDMGFMNLYNYKPKNNVLPDVSKGDIFDFKNVHLVSKKTTAPSRYTDETLGKAMDNVGKFIEDEELSSVLKDAKKGLGTPATRGGVLEKLVNLKMIERKKKAFYATDFGISIIDALKGKDITLPELTATWEQKLSHIEDGTYSPNQFYNEMIEYVKYMIEDYKKTKVAVSQNSDKEVLGKCPKCSGNVFEGKNYYLCEHYKNSCDFVLGKEFSGAKVSKTEVKKLLNGKQTKELEFTWKSNKKGKAKLILEKGKYKLVFDNPTDTKTTSTKSLGKCPTCGGNVVSSKDFYQCENYKKSCLFGIKKEIHKGKITEADIKLILDGKPSNEIEFVWKSGNKGKAKLELKNGNLNFLFN